MSLVLHFSLLLSVSFFTQIPTAHSCSTRCGGLDIPYPFYLNITSCRTYSDAFQVSCINSSDLFLSIASESYRVLRFFPDGVLVDFSNTSACRQYTDFKSFAFSGTAYFGISTDNVLGLSDCEDSSLCKSDCEKISVKSGCDGSSAGDSASCCYPLSDNSAWHPGNNSLSDFSRFGCRGFFSWLVLPGSSVGTRGVKLEWAVPGNSTVPPCAANADVVNASAVMSGIRCQCRGGFVGDGFALGSGCLKSCLKNGKEVSGDDCYRDNRSKKKGVILIGVITSALAIASFAAVCLLKWPVRSSDQSHTFLSSKACRSRLFTYHELEEATGGFEDAQKIVDGTRTTLYAGVLTGGSHVAVHRIQCVSERDLVRVLFKLEALSTVSHRNLARIVGWSVDSTYTSATTPFVVYEHPENGTLEEHLHGRAGDEKTPQLDWYKRVNIASETASILAYLEHDVSPPIYHHDLQTGYIFLDRDFSVKLAGFQLHSSEFSEGSSYEEEGSCFRENDVCSFGVVLLEIITGSSRASMGNFSTMALLKIKNGQLEEIVDPGLYYHVQPQFQREQIEKIADLATRCLLFGTDGKLRMADVAKELTHVARDNLEGSSALEETFSNSSLLQMISMSPDSIYVP